MYRTTKHYDAYGNPILAWNEMRDYYKDDQNSRSLVRSTLPCRYICIPRTIIRIYSLPTPCITAYSIFPGGQVEKDIPPTPRVLAALRTAYRGRGGWKGYNRGGGVVEIVREGRAFYLPYQKYLPFGERGV